MPEHLSHLVESAAHSIRTGLKQATQGLIDRESLVDLIALAAVAQEHLLIIGPPGTAKSAAVRRVAHALGGEYFEYLLGRFTEPSELFGPVDLRKLRDGTVETATEGMLPEADIVFLDEVFLASTAVLNTLLGVLNERIFRRGHTLHQCPLKVCVAAANHLPEDEALAAFADRFLLHTFIEPVSENLLEDLLRGGWQVRHKAVSNVTSLEHLDVLSKAAANADMEQVYQPLTHCVSLLRKEGIMLSDRRLVKSLSLISAAAALRGSTKPDARDLWALVYVIPTQEGQEQSREVLHDILQETENTTLNAAAELASLSLATRAQHIIDRAQTLLPEANAPLPEDALTKLEAIGREIDSSFSPSQMPPELKALREKLIGLLEHSANGSN
ncbi:AAA family ATPase [Zooshikella sp. RANM57]|uniref:AAA family ATPase n=1 Tax=Zooshikella sp. RANM57 TaxID=3425863 RepID=UPI003D6FF3B2